MKLRTKCALLGLSIIGQLTGVSAEPINDASFKEDLLSGRAVQSSISGGSEISFPRGKFFISELFCKFTASTYNFQTLGVTSIPISFESSDSKLSFMNFKTEVPYEYVANEAYKRDGYGLGSLYYTPATPLFVNNLSGKMRMVVRIDAASSEAMDPAKCTVVVVGYKF